MVNKEEEKEKERYGRKVQVGADLVSARNKPLTKNLFLILTTNDYSLATNLRGGVVH